MQPRRLPEPFTRLWLRIVVAALLLTLVTAALPRWWCGRDADRWYEGDADLALAHARRLITRMGPDTPAPGSAAHADDTRETPPDILFFSALALLQIAQAHPELRAELLPSAENAIDILGRNSIHSIDTENAGDFTSTQDGPSGDIARRLGRLNLVLSLHRRVVPESRFSTLNDHLSDTLVRLLRASRHGILETTPGNAYPSDNAAVLGSLLLRARAIGAPPPDAAATMLARFRLAWRAPSSGLLYLRIDPATGLPAATTDAGDTVLAAYLLASGDRSLAKELYENARDLCADTLLGFGFLEMRPRAAKDDGGASLFGISPSGTALALASARIFDDRQHFVVFQRTLHLLGAPASTGGDRLFSAGSPADNAFLLAVLTAGPDVP